MDSKYTINNFDLFDVYGLAQDNRARHFPENVQLPIPSPHSTFIRTSTGAAIAPTGRSNTYKLPVSIVVTSNGDASIPAEDFNTDVYEDSIKNFRENKRLVRDSILNESNPLVRYFPWMPSNISIPDNFSGPDYGFYFYYDTRARILPATVSWEEPTKDRAILSFVLELVGPLRSKIHAWTNDGTATPISPYTNAYTFPKRLFTGPAVKDIVVEFSRATAAANWTLFLTDAASTNENSGIKVTIPSGVKKGAVWVKEGITISHDSFSMEYSWNQYPLHTMNDINNSSDENWAIMLKRALVQSTSPSVNFNNVVKNNFSLDSSKDIVVHSSEALGSSESLKIYYREELA